MMQLILLEVYNACIKSTIKKSSSMPLHDVSSLCMHAGLVLSSMLSLNLPVYHVRLDWLPLPCIAMI